MTSRVLFVLIAVALLVGGVAAVGGLGGDGAPPAVPAGPSAAPLTLVHARPFVTQTPFVHDWRAERPSVDAGWLVVLSVADRELLVPRQLAEPVLYGGPETLQRLNTGEHSGHVVAILPSPRDGDRPLVDLGATVFAHGAPALPESLDAAAVEAGFRAAAQGLSAPDEATLRAVVQPTVTFADLADVQAHAADLIERWSPQEVDLISGLRAPRLTR